MAAAHVSELVTELQTEYDRSRAFLSALEQSLKESRVDDHRREATADGSELGDAAETEAPESSTTCIAAPPKKSSSLLRGKLARFFSRKESKSTSSSKAVVVDPTAENDANVSRVQGLRRASVVALGDHLENSCVAASGGQSPLAKRSQSFVTRSGNSLAAMPPAPQSAAAMMRATSFRAPAPATISSASQYLLDSSLVPPYPAAATVAVSASQLSLPSVDFRRASLSMARGGGAAGGTGGLSGPGQSSSGCRRRNSVEAMLGQAPLPNGGSFSSAGRRASVELPYAVASGAAASVPVASGTGAAGAGVTSTGSGCGTNGASLFMKLQQLNLPISECGVPELLSPVASPRATLAGSTLFAPGAAAAATTSQRTQSMQHSPSFQRRSVTSTISSAQHTFVDGAAHVASGAMQPTASMDCGADAVPLAQVGTGGSSSGASARRSSLHMPPSAAPSLSALRSQSFRHGGVGGSVSRTSTGPGCGACATTAAAITNQHADVAPEDDDDDKFSGELGGVETAMLERRVASMGPMPGGAATSSLMASLLRRADVAIAASAPPIGSSGGATPNAASGPAGMFAGAVDVADVVASGASEADALLSPLPPGGGASGAGSRHVSGAAAFVPVGALCGSPSSRRLTATQLTPPLLVSPVGHRAATLLQSHNSFGHALSPTPPPAGPLAPQPPHGVLGAAATVDGSQSPAAGGAVASPSYLSQHRRMSFRASSSTTACGTPGSGFSGSAAFVI